MAMYTQPTLSPAGYTLLKTFNETKGKTPRIGLYDNGPLQVVVFRGTSDGVDVKDDVALSLGESTGLEQEGDMMVKEITKPCIATGHSLGGYGAMKFAQKYHIPCVVFNAAASAMSPVTSGPGLGSVAYHIVGDLVSSHIGENALTVVRIDIGFGFSATLFCHSLQRFLEERPGKLISSGEENYVFAEFRNGLNLGVSLIHNLTGGLSTALREITLLSASFINKNFQNLRVLPGIPNATMFVKDKTGGGGIRQSRSGTVLLGVKNRGSARRADKKQKRYINPRTFKGYKEDFMFRRH
jgi:hypothetical protein